MDQTNVTNPEQTVVEDNKVETMPQESTQNSENVEQPKSYSEDEFNKAIQSARSKAKYELLQELNIKSVDDFKNQVKQMTEYESKYTDLQKQVEDLNNTVNKYKENEFLSNNNVRLEKRDDFLKLLGNPSENEMESKIKDLKENYPQLFKTQEKISIGNDKSDIKKEQQFSEDFLRKFPWLRK